MTVRPYACSDQILVRGERGLRAFADGDHDLLGGQLGHVAGRKQARHAGLRAAGDQHVARLVDVGQPADQLAVRFQAQLDEDAVHIEATLLACRRAHDQARGHSIARDRLDTLTAGSQFSSSSTWAARRDPAPHGGVELTMRWAQPGRACSAIWASSAAPRTAIGPEPISATGLVDVQRRIAHGRVGHALQRSSGPRPAR